MASAILLFPALGASPPAATGSFECDSVNIYGTSRLQALGASGLWLPLGNGTFSWHTHGTELEVFWVRDTYLETGQPTDPTKPQHTQFIRQETGNNSLRDAKAEAARTSTGSQFLAFAANGALLDGDLQRDLRVGPTNDQQWTRGNPQPATNRPISIPAGTMTAQTTTARVTLKGDFFLSLTDANVTVTNGTAKYEFRAGNWTEGIAGQGPMALLRYRIFQWVTLVVTHATLETTSDRHPMLLLVRNLSIDGNISTEMRDVEGTVGRAGQRLPVDISLARYDGSMRVTVRNESRLGDRLLVEIEAAPEVLGLDALEDPPPGDNGLKLARPEPRLLRPLAFTFAAAAGIVSALFLVVQRRRSAPGLEMVEGELRSRRPETARRYARRRLARDPADGNALFFLATTYFVRKEFRQLLAEVEPRAATIGINDRRSVAYLLAVAAHTQEDGERLERWAREAAREPLLEARLALGGIWTRPQAEPVSPKVVDDALPLYA